MTDWNAYLSDFHARHPGITEDVLARARDGDQTPYSWLAAALPDHGSVLDLCCGSAPLAGGLPNDWVGVDRSRDELARARERGANRLVIGDASALPFRAKSFDAIACSMALMIATPRESVVSEAARVLLSGGTLVATIPASRPLRGGDRARLARLVVALRSAPRWPSPTRTSRYERALRASGFDILTVERKSFALPIRSHADAETVVDSLYLPNSGEHARNRAVDLVAGWKDRHPFPVPLTRLVARRR